MNFLMLQDNFCYSCVMTQNKTKPITYTQKVLLFHIHSNKSFSSSVNQSLLAMSILLVLRSFIERTIFPDLGLPCPICVCISGLDSRGLHTKCLPQTASSRQFLRLDSVLDLAQKQQQQVTHREPQAQVLYEVHNNNTALIKS